MNTNKVGRNKFGGVHPTKQPPDLRQKLQQLPRGHWGKSHRPASISSYIINRPFKRLHDSVYSSG